MSAESDPGDPNPMEYSACVPIPQDEGEYYHETVPFFISHPDIEDERVQLGHSTRCGQRVDLKNDHVQARGEFEKDGDRDPCPDCYGGEGK